MYGKVIQLHVHRYPFVFRFFSHVGCYSVSSRVLCAEQEVGVGCLFSVQQDVYVHLKLLIYPSPGTCVGQAGVLSPLCAAGGPAQEATLLQTPDM